MIHRRTIIKSLLVFTLPLFSNCNAQEFITIEKTQFIKNKKPYHYIGANYWYGAMLGRENGDRERLIKELDELKSLGITNLRILASAEGGDQDYTVTPAVQPQQGIYDENLWIGLDFLLNERSTLSHQ